MGWRNCNASISLVSEVNIRWPRRSKLSDGTIGDTAHQKVGTSDHLPNSAGVVRARDITVAGIDAAWLAEHLRQLGAKRDSRLVGGGYIIFNRRITKPDFSGWKVYTGANPHVAHLHVSFTRIAGPQGYDSTSEWGLNVGLVQNTPTSTYCRYNERNDRVRTLQEFMTSHFPAYNAYRPTGYYGDATKAGMAEFQRRTGITGPDADGSIVGPRTMAELRKQGFRP